MNLPGPVVLYDGECGLCHRSVKFLLERDRSQLWYAALQGETAAQLRAEHPRIPGTLESVVLVDGGRVHLRSKAILHAAAIALGALVRHPPGDPRAGSRAPGA
jgi:predicted DCC family thiol-disulfide oxidoreductase YuxK